MFNCRLWLWLGLMVLAIATDSCLAVPYFGKKIGSFKTYHHGVVGDVYAVDARTIHIRGFNYDGEGPDAFFWAGSTEKPDGTGFIVINEKGTKDVLHPYRNKDITITLPEGKTFNDIKWLAVWCRLFAANFGEVFIPPNFEYPKLRRLDRIIGKAHNTSSGPIVAVDAQTFMIPNFYLDGQAPDAHFWAGTGPKPTANGILVPDENGSDKPLGRYDGQSLVISLPGQMTVFDIDWLGVWCREFSVDFGHILIPKDLNVPPSLKMLGVSPQSKLNCEVLSEGSDRGFEVRWAKAGDTVVIQLVARLEAGEYMSFGLSGLDDRSKMVGGDVAVAWIDQTSGAGHVVDYFLEDTSQCSNGRGSCPDYRIEPNTNTVRLLNAVRVNGYDMITYQRPIHAVDRLDKPISDDGPQPIIWAIGPLNDLNEVSVHSSKNKRDMFIDFYRTPQWNCPAPLGDSSVQNDPVPSPSPSHDSSINLHLTPTRHPSSNANVQPANTPRPPSSGFETGTAAEKKPVGPTAAEPNADAWYIPPIECPEPQDNVFYAQIGPAGGKKGYIGITGHVGWGIAWYINGLLIPEITVVRGKTYTFVVEGGNDIDTPARNHPFYITDDPVGGYVAKTPEEREKVHVFAGIRLNSDGEPEPSAAGRLCEWVQKSKENAEKYNSFGEYQRVLELSCDKGQAAVLQWTPDADTPDLVYYQCFRHRYLGWKIHVLDQCEFDHAFGSSILHETNIDSHLVPDQEFKNVARSLPNEKQPHDSVSSVVSSKIAFDPVAPDHIRPGTVKFLQGFNPVTIAPKVIPIGVHLPRPPPKMNINNTFVKDPFTSNKSVPFQVGFQPGEPQFGGFGASDFGQRFEKAPPVYISKRIVPLAPIIPNLPSRLGNVYQPFQHRDSAGQPKTEEMTPSAQHPVVFRAPAPQGGIPPPPPQLPTPQRPPNGSFIRRRIRPVTGQHPHQPISADGTPISSGQSPINPSLSASRPKRPTSLQSTRAFGPFKGTTPPPIPSKVPELPQFSQQNSHRQPQQKPLTKMEGISRPQNVQPPQSSNTTQNDLTILSNVMSIINAEKESGQHKSSAQTVHRRISRAAGKDIPETEPTAEPEAEPEAKPDSNHEHKHEHPHQHDNKAVNNENNKSNATKESSAQMTEQTHNSGTRFYFGCDMHFNSLIFVMLICADFLF